MSEVFTALVSLFNLILTTLDSFQIVEGLSMGDVIIILVVMLIIVKLVVPSIAKGGSDEKED